MKANCLLVTVTIFIHGIVSQDSSMQTNLSNGDTGVNSGVSSLAASGVTPAGAVDVPGGGRVGRDADQDLELSFQDIPEFISANNTQTVAEGDDTTLSCQVNKLSQFSMIWSRRHKENDIDWKVLRIGETGVVIKKDDPRFHFEEGSTVLRINNVQHEDEGLYKCEIAVQTNSPKIYVELIVTPPGENAGTNPHRTWTNGGSGVHPPQPLILTVIVSILLLHLLKF